MITVGLLFIAVVCWLLAALNCPAPSPINWGWLGMFFFGLSLLWPHLGIR